MRREALGRLVESAQRSLSCVTESVLELSRGWIAGSEHIDLWLGRAAPARLRADKTWLLVIRSRYGVAPPSVGAPAWQLHLNAYSYSLLNDSHEEVLAYQWHPVGQSYVRHPHLHLGPAGGVRLGELSKAHLPTGVVALNNFLRFLITEFRVRPRRDDWSQIFDQTR